MEYLDEDDEDSIVGEFKVNSVELTNRFHFCVRLYCNRSQMTS